MPIPCEQVYTSPEDTAQFRDQIGGMLCADMGSEASIQLQDGGEFYEEANGADFYFAVNTCAKFQSITQRQDCYTQEESEAILYDFIVTTKISSQFFSPKTYI